MLLADEIASFFRENLGVSPKKTIFASVKHEKGISMALSQNKSLKLYYSIKEVAGMIGVNESLLRYWEKEFPHLRPKTVSSTGVRQYTEKDIDQVKRIYNLVKERGFKLSAARKYLNENRGGVDRSSEVLQTLMSLRDQLKDLKKHLDYSIV